MSNDPRRSKTLGCGVGMIGAPRNPGRLRLSEVVVELSRGGGVGAVAATRIEWVRDCAHRVTPAVRARVGDTEEEEGEHHWYPLRLLPPGAQLCARSKRGIGARASMFIVVGERRATSNAGRAVRGIVVIMAQRARWHGGSGRIVSIIWRIRRRRSQRRRVNSQTFREPLDSGCRRL